MTIRAADPRGVIALVLLLAGCLVGPNYHRPPPADPPAAQYKELAGWTQAAPADAGPKGDWWTDFNDPLLDQLEPTVRISNQTVQADYQNYQRGAGARARGRRRAVPDTRGRRLGDPADERRLLLGTGRGIIRQDPDPGNSRSDAELGARYLGQGAPHDRGERS